MGVEWWGWAGWSGEAQHGPSTSRFVAGPQTRDSQGCREQPKEELRTTEVGGGGLPGAQVGERPGAGLQPGEANLCVQRGDTWVYR